jgi:hypothetical protein
MYARKRILPVFIPSNNEYGFFCMVANPGKPHTPTEAD